MIFGFFQAPRDSLFYQLLLKYKRDKYAKLDNVDDIVVRFKDIGRMMSMLLSHLYRNKFSEKPFANIGTSDTKRILAQTVSYWIPDYFLQDLLANFFFKISLRTNMER